MVEGVPDVLVPTPEVVVRSDGLSTDDSLGGTGGPVSRAAEGAVASAVIPERSMGPVDGTAGYSVSGVSDEVDYSVEDVLCHDDCSVEFTGAIADWDLMVQGGTSLSEADSSEVRQGGVEMVRLAPGGVSSGDTPPAAEKVNGHWRRLVASGSMESSLDIVRALNIPYWETNLPKIESPQVVESLISGLKYGVRIGREPASGVICSPNWPSVNVLHEQVSEVINSDLQSGRLFGPFVSPPYDCYVVSPLGAFLKRNSTKARVIHDLSFPFVGSVNSQIDPLEYSLQYSSVDDAVELCCRVTSPPPYMAKVDLKDAFKHIPLHPSDWHLMGLSWGDGTGRDLFYFSKVLSFGLRSAPALFDNYARYLPSFAKLEGCSSGIVRYVDDFLLVSDSKDRCQADLEVLVKASLEAGFTIQPSKVAGPDTVMEFLGIEIDSCNGQLRISDCRMAEILELLNEWKGRRSCSKRHLLRLIGKLAFAARVVRKGRAFLGRLISLAKGLKCLHFRTRLSIEARRDIDWWSKSLVVNNGVALFPRDWSSEAVFHVFTDASDHGYGAWMDAEWFAVAYVADSAPLVSRSINWRELHAAVKALATWGSRFAGRCVLFHIDNQATCGLLTKLYTPCEDLMELVRTWALLLEAHSIEARVEYISTTDNYGADALSRGLIPQFQAAFPQASSPTWPAPVRYFDTTV